MASASNASGSPTGDLRAERGDDAGSNAACRQPVRFVARDALLAKAGGALFAGKLGIAEGLCRQCLKQDPTNVSAIRMLADVAVRLGRHHDAEKLLARCLELAPDFHLARNNYAQLLFKTFRYREALAEIDQEPESIGDRYHLSFALGKALPVVSAASSRAPTHRGIYRFWVEWLPTNWRNSAPSTSSFTATTGRFVPRVRSRCASPFMPTLSSNGDTTKATSLP